MRHIFYKLDEENNAVKCEVEEWGAALEKASRIVKQDTIGNVQISTVFLGIDNNICFDDSEPHLFETMIFGGEHNDYQTRCSTWDQALLMHEAALLIVKSTNGI